MAPLSDSGIVYKFRLHRPSGRVAGPTDIRRIVTVFTGICQPDRRPHVPRLSPARNSSRVDAIASSSFRVCSCASGCRMLRRGPQSSASRRAKGTRHALTRCWEGPEAVVYSERETTAHEPQAPHLQRVQAASGVVWLPRGVLTTTSPAGSRRCSSARSTLLLLGLTGGPPFPSQRR